MNNYELHSRAQELSASHSGYNLARRLLALEEELQEARREFGQPQQTQGEAVADGIEAAAAWVDARAYAYIEEHGSYDPDTGVTEFAVDGADYLLELEEIAEGIRSLAPSAPAAVPDVELIERFIKIMSEIALDLDGGNEWDDDPIPEELWQLYREATAPTPAEPK